jgi:DNA-binding winged helix-turn-helix (wHTH) protein/tetratricopeptide (TPR) repeat protein
LRNAPEADSTATDFGGEVEEPACSFAGLRLEADGTLWRGEAVVHLPPKELAALRRLLAHAGQVVSPTQLKHELWGDVHVTDDSVSKCLSSLRARLEPDACIQTVYKRGYRFSAEIRRHRAVPAGRLPRLAIMPFATRYSVPEYLGPAIAEETIARLSSARPPAVAVLARDSVFSLTLRGLTAQQIGQELKADLVLTGSIRAFPSHYRLRAEMVRVEDGRQIWVEDMLASQSLNGGLESELMCRLAFRLSQGDPDVRFWPPERPEQKNGGLEIAATAAGTEDEDEPGARQAEAYDYFLRGHHEWQTPHRHRMQDGLQHLLRAIDLDPSLIVAKVDLANLCVTQAFCGFMSPSTSADLVRRVAESIPDLPHRAEAIPPALGWINFHFDRNLSSALLAFSLETPPPHDSWTTYTHTIFALSRHRFAEAIALLRANIHADPFSPCLYARLAWALHLDGQKGESVEQIRKALALFPHHEGTGLYGAAILAFNGEIEHAVELARGLAKRLPDSDLASAVHAYTLACAGRPDEAHSLLERLQWLGRERYVLRSFTPAAYLALGEHETALAELQAAEEARCPWFFQMMADPRLKALQGCPEFERMRAILPSMEAEAEQD